jgi:transposase
MHIRELQALVHRLEVLQQMRQQENNRLEGRVSPYIKMSIDKIIETLSKEIDEIKMEIANSIDKNVELRSKKELLNTIPGIGEATIAQILAFFGNIVSAHEFPG